TFDIPKRVSLGIGPLIERTYDDLTPVSATIHDKGKRPRPVDFGHGDEFFLSGVGPDGIEATLHHEHYRRTPQKPGRSFMRFHYGAPTVIVVSAPKTQKTIRCMIVHKPDCLHISIYNRASYETKSSRFKVS